MKSETQNTVARFGIIFNRNNKLFSGESWLKLYTVENCSGAVTVLVGMVADCTGMVMVVVGTVADCSGTVTVLVRTVAGGKGTVRVLSRCWCFSPTTR